MNILIKKDAVPFIKQLTQEECGILLQALCDEIEGKENDLTDKPNVNMAKLIILESNKRATAESKFVPPTIEEVREYCQERKNNVDPVKFVSYYNSANWYRGKTKIKNWKQCVITWEQNNFDKPKKKPVGRVGYDWDELERKLTGGN